MRSKHWWGSDLEPLVRKKETIFYGIGLYPIAMWSRRASYISYGSPVPNRFQPGVDRLLENRLKRGKNLTAPTAGSGCSDTQVVQCCL